MARINNPKTFNYKLLVTTDDVIAQYSENGSSWTDTATDNSRWFRLSYDKGKTWFITLKFSDSGEGQVVNYSGTFTRTDIVSNVYTIPLNLTNHPISIVAEIDTGVFEKIQCKVLYKSTSTDVVINTNMIPTTVTSFAYSFSM